MKVKDFFKAVHGAERLCEDFPERDVEVRLYNSDGVRITSNIELDVCSYMFSPWVTHEDGTKGSMVLEIKLKS